MPACVESLKMGDSPVGGQYLLKLGCLGAISVLVRVLCFSEPHVFMVTSWFFD